MSAAEVSEHLSYWNDEMKVAAYSAALDEVVCEGDHVLDLGTGTGLLGMLAARAGASKVWAFDRGAIIHPARHLAEQNGFGEQIEFVRALTTEVELPPVDVLVCDQIGGLAFDAGVLDYFADAKRRALKPDGILVPSAFDLYLAPVHAPEKYGVVADWRSDRAGFDLSPMRSVAANNQYSAEPKDVAICEPGQRFASVLSSDNSRIQGSCTWTASADHVVHGFVGWFDATMSPSVHMTNDPVDPSRMQRWINFYPVLEPIELEAGARLAATIDILTSARLVTWTSCVNGGPVMKQSTFHGSFEPGPPMKKRPPDARTMQRRELLGELLRLDENGAGVAELVGACKNRSDMFATDQAATDFAHGFMKLL